MLNIPLNLRKLLLVTLLPPLHTNRINNLNMCNLLILVIYLLPLPLQPLPQFINLLLS